MNPEEYLDRLIERHEQGELYVHAINDDVAASLGAAEALAQLKEIQIPYEFANNLELSIRARARNLTEQNRWNIPLAQTHSLTEQNGWHIPPVQSRNQASSRRFIKHRAWVSLLRIAAVFIIAAVGVLTASARSLPGDALYSLKQAEIQFTSTFSGVSQNSANLQINQLRSAIADLNTVVNDGRNDDAIRLALETVAAKTSDSQEAIAALPADSARDEAQGSLASALTEEDQILHQLLNNVDWPIRLTFTQQLGTLGEQVPTVTNVVVRTQGNGMLLIILTGTHFAPQAQLMIDGRQNGVVSKSTPTQLLAVFSSAAWPSGIYAIGVRNPDGTAAQLIINSDDDNNPDREGSNHNRHGTPVPYPKGSPDD
jgi:hypothetical protein